MTVTAPSLPHSKSDQQPLKYPLSNVKHEVMTSTQLFLKVGFLGLAFSLIFTGYNVAQSFVTTMYRETGFAALGLIYLTFAITSLFAPLINGYLEAKCGAGSGEKVTMILSGFVYVLFVLSLVTGSVMLVMLGSFLKGIGSGLLWISEGIWLAKIVRAFREQHDDVLSSSGPQEVSNTENVVGIANGVFFTLFNLNGIIGNLVVIALIHSGAGMQSTIYIMAVLIACGAALIMFASRAPVHADSQNVSYEMLNIISGGDTLGSTETVATIEKTLENSTAAGRLRSIFRLAKQRKTLLLSPYLFCQGINLSYTYGNYPTFIQLQTLRTTSSTEEYETMVALNIAYCFLAYGFGSMSGSYIWGKVYDFYHSKIYPLLWFHVALVLLAFPVLAISTVGNDNQPSISPLVFVGFLFGLVDFLTNAVINNSITRNYDASDVPIAFSWYRFCFCIGFAFAAAISSLLPNVTQSVSSEADKFDHYGWVFMICFNIGAMIISVVYGNILERLADMSIAARRRSEFIVSIH